MTFSRRTVCRGRLCVGGLGIVAATAMVGAGTAHADTVADLLGQASADLSQSDYSALFNPDTPTLPSLVEFLNQSFFTVGQTVEQGFDADIVPAADQTNPLLLDAANELVSADQTLLNLAGAAPGELVADDVLVQDAANNFGNIAFAENLESAAANTDVGAGAAAAGTITPDGVTGQAISDLNQGAALLDTAPTADLSARSAELITGQETLVPELDSGLAQLAAMQDKFSLFDQTLLASVDEQLVSASQNILSADQGFVAADQAGDLSGSGFNVPDLTVIGGYLDFLGAYFNADGASILADLTGGLANSSVSDIASTLDPSIFADALSSIGL